MVILPILIGILLGCLSGWGVGGGTLLILWLTLCRGMEPQLARGINLIFFIVSAGVVSLIRWKRGAVSFRKLLPAIAAGCIGAVVFSLVSRYMDVSHLKKLFGLLLIAAGLRELTYRPRKAR